MFLLLMVEVMVKTSKEQIQRDEQKVIQELEKNAHESIEEIAKRCGFSRQKVWRIIKRLEQNKTIWGYNAVVDDEKLGLKQFLVLIKRKNRPVSSKQLETITSRKLKTEMAKIGCWRLMRDLGCIFGFQQNVEMIFCCLATWMQLEKRRGTLKDIVWVLRVLT